MFSFLQFYYAKIQSCDIIKKHFLIFYFYLPYFYRKGLVAQWTRACGYEPQSRGFESLLAHFKTSVCDVFYKTKNIKQNRVYILLRKMQCFCLSTEKLDFVKNKSKKKGFYKIKKVKRKPLTEVNENKGSKKMFIFFFIFCVRGINHPLRHKRIHVVILTK